MAFDLVITAAAVVTMDDAVTVHAPGAVAITGDRIAAVGSSTDAAGWAASRRLDRPDCALLPGFVDAHDHLFQSLARHHGDGLGLHDWLQTCMWPYADRLDGPRAVIATRFAAMELARAGVTSVLDHAYAPTDPEVTLAVAAAIEQVGLRGFVARGVYGTPLVRNPTRRPSLLDTEPELALLRSLMDRRRHDRVRIAPGPTNAATVEPGVLTGAAALAREYEVPWQTHCCEVPADAATVRSRTGATPVAWMDHLGVLDHHATLAHLIWIDDADVALMAASGAAAVHCPTSNLRNGSGIMPVTALLAAGVPVAMGVDGSVGHHADPFEAMRAAIGVQRIAHGPTAMTAGDALAMATRLGARALGIDAGVVEAGRLADVVCVRLPAIAEGDLVARIVWGASPGDVSDVVVGGRLVVDAGRVVTVDEASIRADADLAARSLWSDRSAPGA